MAVSEFSPLATRQIHLDFHTGPAIPDVAADFDPREFARTMKQAHVNSVTVFAKCHHGHLYYNTARPERHPGLKSGIDLLGQQVEALHREGIRAPIYLSVQCDEFAADTHPEWIARTPDGRPVGSGPFEPDAAHFYNNWQILDMSSAYQDYLAEQTAEVLKIFRPVDGLFFDMCWDQPSCSHAAVAGMLKKNFNPENEADRQAYAHQVSLAYMKRFYDMIRAASPRATVYFNSRPLGNLAEEIPYLTQVEIEALPTGGWGYMYFPKNVRFARNFGRDYLGMTARFHKAWADFGGIKPYAALEYETSQMMAHGAKCSIGDQLHPRGRLDAAVYDLIGSVYRRVEKREPWLKDAQPVTEIGVFRTISTDYHGAGGTEEGVTRMLTQLKYQFDIVDAESNWEQYALLILPDATELSAETARRLSAYIQRGGAVLCSGTSGLNKTGDELLLPELGVIPKGLSPFSVTYMHFGSEVNRDVPPTTHVMYDRTVRVLPAPGGRSVAAVAEPYFERSWRHFSSHAQVPNVNNDSGFAAAVVSENGRVAYIAAPIFGAFARHGNYPYRLLVRNLIERLLPEPLLKLQGVLTGTEATVMHQTNRDIVHLLNYSAERRTPTLDIVEDVAPLHNVTLSLKQPHKPTHVYIAPSREELSFEYAAGRATVAIPKINGHEMVVFEQS